MPPSLNIMKKYIAISLIISLLCSLIPAQLVTFADDTDRVTFEIKYKLNNDGPELTAEVEYLGDWIYRNRYIPAPLSLVSLPANAYVTECNVKNIPSEYALVSQLVYAGGSCTIPQDSNSPFHDFIAQAEDEDKGMFITGNEFRGSGGSDRYFRYFIRYLKRFNNNGSEIINKIPIEQNLKGFVVTFQYKKQEDGQNIYQYPAVIFQYKKSTQSIQSNTKALEAEILRVTGENENNWLKANDFYSGSNFYNESGWWQDFQKMLSRAQNMVQSPPLQFEVDVMTNRLRIAINKLISVNEVNASALYQKVLSVNPLIEDQTKYNRYTDSSYQALINARDDAKAMLASLYEDEPIYGVVSTTAGAITTSPGAVTTSPGAVTTSPGSIVISDTTEPIAMGVKPSTINVSAYQSTVDAVYTVLQDSIDHIVNKQPYQERYDFYRLNKANADALLAKYKPDNLNSAEFTAPSWQSFVAAYDKLATTMQKPVTGDGSYREYRILDDFGGDNGTYGHYPDLQKAINRLVSTVDIVVSFKYANNIAAFYPESHQTGDYVYQNQAVTLKAGNTTIKGAAKTAGLKFDEEAFYRQLTLDGFSQSKQEYGAPHFMFYINGECRGFGNLDSLAEIQLKSGDNVTLLRIPKVYFRGEHAADLDSVTKWFGEAIFQQSYLFGNSLAEIALTTNQTSPKVGDKVNFSVSATGAYHKNAGQALSTKNIALFVSAPSQTEVYSNDLSKTTAVDDGSGQLSYIFGAPGWYTVAAFNTVDHYSSQNVVAQVTEGHYGSLYAADFKLFYVAPADDPAALLIKQRAENLAKAKVYDEQYTADDFKDDDYAAFKAKYQTLIDNQNNATDYKALMAAYEADLGGLKQFIADHAIDHAQIINHLRRQLVYLPRDLNQLDYTHERALRAVQHTYKGLNSYQKTLLSQTETNFLKELAAQDINALNKPAALTIDVVKDANVNLAQSSGPLGVAPNENSVSILYSDDTKSRTYYAYSTLGSYAVNGEITNPIGGGAVEPPSTGMAAIPGNLVLVRRNITLSDDHYWLAYRKSDTEDWQLMQSAANNDGVTEKLLKAEFIMPNTGQPLTLSYKAINKAEFQQLKLAADSSGMTLDKQKAIYKQALEDVFNSYDSARYSADGYIDLRDAKNKGLRQIDEAVDLAAALNYYNNAAKQMAAVEKLKQVRVIVSNNTYSKAEGAPWDGVLVDQWVDIDDKSSMMNRIEKVVVDAGFPIEIRGGAYISSINQLAEFDGGNGSGWMGTLNDWFTNEGFAEFSVANGKLNAGDVIDIVYTRELGADVHGGFSGNIDTTLEKLQLSNGQLIPAFDPAVKDYVFAINSDASSSQLSYLANVRSFQARAYKERYAPKAEQWIKDGSTLYLKNGDVLYVGIGEPSWASMGKAEPSVYSIAIVQGDSGLADMIDALPAATHLTYQDKLDVDRAYLIYQSLTAKEKSNLGTARSAKIKACAARMTGLQAAAEVTAQLLALPAPHALSYRDRVSVEATKAAFDALGADQAEIPRVLIDKLNNCLSALKELAPHNSDDDIANILKDSLNKIATDTVNPTTATLGGDWSMLTLARGNYEIPKHIIEKYKANVLDVIKGKMQTSDDRLHAIKSTEHARAILGLTAVGIDPTDLEGLDITKALGSVDYLKKQGINGPIFGLIALNTHDYAIATAPTGETQATRDAIIKEILAAEIRTDSFDGGFALSGSVPDPDITAMALQALAPYYDARSDVKASVDRALAVLSNLQDSVGGYSSFGTANSESVAQVIVALTALGKNPKTDPMFVKNGSSLIDNLLTFAVDGGGFKHISDGKVDGMATDQGTYALVAYDRFVKEQNSLYDMTDVVFKDVVVKQPTLTIIGAKDHEAFNETPLKLTITAKDYQGNKLIPTVTFNGVTLTAKDDIYSVEFVKEQNVLKVVATDNENNVTSKTLQLLYFKKISPVDPNDPTDPVNPDPADNVVTLSVDKETIGKGYVLAPVEVELRDGDTVWDVFRRELTRRDIDFRYSFYEKYNSVYIESIDGDGEFDHGSGSGWMYSVNGTYPQFGASLITLKAGDVIKWRYTTNLGYDIGGGPAIDGDAGLRTTLEEYLISAKAYSKLEYTEASYQKLQAAIEAGTAMLNDANATSTKLLEAVQALDRAIKGMRRLPKDVIDTNKSAAAKSTETADENLIIKQMKTGEIDIPLEQLTKKFVDRAQISDWAHDSIAKAVYYKIVKGDDKGNFKPKALVSRAEIAQMFSNLITGIDPQFEAKQFSDIPQDKWYSQAIDNVVRHGIMQGTGESFKPEEHLTREQLAVTIMRYYDGPVNQIKQPTDIDMASNWAQIAITRAFSLGLIQGDGQNFNPKGKVTREMAITILVRMLELELKTQQ